MSTFNGIVTEFPRIRIDFFRLNPSYPPPVACFLSHVHSDHLQGLESLKSPFVYCSHATRRLLLTMEKYPHRMNFSKGILESRVQTYKHLKTVLRPIPIETPTEIELSPVEKIRVTLFDANHCPGAVMFLIEGNNKAILYTGDIRAEPWWVNSLLRNPVLVPYTLGHARLDKVYLDTTFATKEDIYKEFPTKASGLSELIEKVSKYPPDTVYYFRAWTLGYEDVWLTLSSLMRSQVHIDEYQWRLYQSLAGRHPISDALTGFQFGNRIHDGCLSPHSDLRIHSCEPGTRCHAELSKKNVVWITPIISRTDDGQEVLELGAGGGGGDLYQVPLLDITEATSLQKLEQLFIEKIEDQGTLSTVLGRLYAAQDACQFKISLEGIYKDVYADITIDELVDSLSKDTRHQQKDNAFSKAFFNDPPDTIHFPFSRHSSYSELCHLLSAFQPKDVYPCTVDKDTWSEEVSMRYLFGHCCSENTFSHDEKMHALLHERAESTTQRKRKREAGSQPDSQLSGPEDSSQTRSFETAREASDLQTVDTANRVSNHDHDPCPSVVIDAMHPGATVASVPLTADNTLLQHVNSDKHTLTSKQKAVKKLQKSRAEEMGMLWLDSSLPSSNQVDGREDLRSPASSSPMVVNRKSHADSQAAATISLTSLLDSQNLLLPSSPESRSQRLQQEGEELSTPRFTTQDFYQQSHSSSSSDERAPPPDATAIPVNSATKARIRRRVAAYNAARLSLADAEDSGGWRDFSPMSTGNCHTEEEVEL